MTLKITTTQVYFQKGSHRQQKSYSGLHPPRWSCSTYLWNNLKKKLTWWRVSTWNVSFSIHLWVTVTHKCTVLYYSYFALLMWTFGADWYIYISKVKNMLFLILLIYLCISKGGRYLNREIIQDVFFVGIWQWCWNSCQRIAVQLWWWGCRNRLGVRDFVLVVMKFQD